ncbi:hypothetical protein GDO78_003702 [Eleutherodactylus coqui]|uniref:Uncharacterized protein n=1 Tax=Eleutherodactylus coqui TaxID=57060 RepID=A0A8J6EU69_ELECQ|nr:hypothetical protein GDO78_003702 [Eleutherodactylus coqui]
MHYFTICIAGNTRPAPPHLLVLSPRSFALFCVLFCIALQPTVFAVFLPCIAPLLHGVPFQGARSALSRSFPPLYGPPPGCMAFLCTGEATRLVPFCIAYPELQIGSCKHFLTLFLL